MKITDLRTLLSEEPMSGGGDDFIPPPIQPGNIIPPPFDGWTGTMDEWYRFYQNIYPDAVPPPTYDPFPSGRTPIGPRELPDVRDTGNPMGPNMGDYNHRPWHFRDGQWVFDPHSPGGYSHGERRLLMPTPPSGPGVAPGWSPKSPPTGPGHWVPNPDGGAPIFVPPANTPPGTPGASPLGPRQLPNPNAPAPTPWRPVPDDSPRPKPIRSTPTPSTPSSPIRWLFPRG